MTILQNLNNAQSILQIADKLLSPDGKDYIKELVKLSITLPAEEQAKADEAREFIAKSDNIKADIIKQTNDANSRLAERERLVKIREASAANANDLKAEAIAISSKNAEKEAALKTEATRLDGITKIHAETTKKHAETLKKIDDENLKLNNRKTALDIREKAINDYEQEVEDTAQQMSGLVKQKLRK